MLRTRPLLLLLTSALVCLLCGRAQAQDGMPTDGPDRRFVALNLDGGGLWQAEGDAKWLALGRVGAGAGWFNGSRLRTVQVELGAQTGWQWAVGVGGELASVRTGLAGGAALLRNLSSEAFGGRIELGFKILRLQASAFADPEGTKQLGAFVRIPVGLIASVLTGRL